MNIKEMHYDFKSKLNKIDSSQYRNLAIPDIDLKLNEATLIFIKSIAEPRFIKNMWLEMNQRTIDDLRTIVVNSTSSTTLTQLNSSTYISDLPLDYMFYIKSRAKLKKESCEDFVTNIIVRGQKENHEISPFDVSSFEWRELNIHFVQNVIKIFTDGTFSVEEFYIDYLKRPQFIHNAEDFQAGTYTLLDGTILTGTQNCELPFQVHNEIVDIAVLITANEINAADYQLKNAKIQLNQ